MCKIKSILNDENINSSILASIFSFEHLYQSYLDCCRNKRWKESVTKFSCHATYNIYQIQKEILTNQYKPSFGRQFDIIERGKKRHITPPAFKERILEKCLCDNYLIPLLSKSLIYDCGATLKNKGIAFTRNRLHGMINKSLRTNSVDKLYVLTLDIHHYFDSINHNTLIKLLKDKKKISLSLLNIIEQIINSNHKDVGLGLGSQISQICALYYLSELDHIIKEQFHIKYYIRYMDDMILFSDNKVILEQIKNFVREWLLNNRQLELNWNKSLIKRLDKNFIFMKTKYIIKSDRRIIKLLTTDSYKRIKNKLKKYPHQEIFYAWWSYIKRFNAYKKRKRVLNLFHKLITT